MNQIRYLLLNVLVIVVMIPEKGPILLVLPRYGGVKDEDEDEESRSRGVRTRTWSRLVSR